LSNYQQLQVKVLAAVPTNNLNSYVGGGLGAVVNVAGFGYNFVGLNETMGPIPLNYYYATIDLPSNQAMNLNTMEATFFVSSDTATTGTIVMNIYDVEIVEIL
jgi:hypothetical protein